MYFHDIFNIEMERVSRTVHVDGVYRLAELDKDYWSITPHGADENNPDGLVLQISPLFNCKTLISNNPMDYVLEENKVLVCQNEPNTEITCV